jgi:hypothetical protein
VSGIWTLIQFCEGCYKMQEGVWHDHDRCLLMFDVSLVKDCS